MELNISIRGYEYEDEEISYDHDSEFSSDSEMSSPEAPDFECPWPVPVEKKDRLLQTTKIIQSRRKNFVPLETLAFREAAKHLDFIYDSNPEMIFNLPNGIKTLILEYFYSMHNPETLKSTYFPQTIKRKLPLHVLQALISGSLKNFDFAVCELDASPSQSENQILLSIWECLAANAGNLREVSDLTNKCLSVANIMQCLEKFEHLEVLKLRFYGADHADLEMIGIKLPKIEELDMHFEVSSSPELGGLVKLKCLHKIQFDVRQGVRHALKYECADFIFKMMPNLRLIKPHNYFNPHLDEYLLYDLSGLTQTHNLEHLGIRFNEDIEKIPAIFPNLRHLSIRQWENHLLLPNTMQKLSYLHSLHISMNNMESATVLVLPTLELVGTRITDLSIDSGSSTSGYTLDVSRILELCPNLECLKLFHLRCGEPQIFCPLKLKIQKFYVSTHCDSHALFVPMLLLQSPCLEEARIDYFHFDEEAFRCLDMALETGHVFENLVSLTFHCKSSATNVSAWFRNLLAKIIAASPKLNITLCEILPHASVYGYGYYWIPGYNEEDQMELAKEEFNEEMECFYKAVAE